MHIYHNEKERIANVVKELKNEFQNVKIFDNKMETLEINTIKKQIIKSN